jgi:TonB-linked SusC/RagA family outer membrane protein
LNHNTELLFRSFISNTILTKISFMKMKKRLLTMLCLSALLLWQSASYAQELTLARRNDRASEQRESIVRKQLKEVIQDLKKRFDVDFIYENNVLEGKKVSYTPQQNESFENLLSSVLSSVHLNYKKIDQRVYAIVPQTIEKKEKIKKEKDIMSITTQQEKFFLPAFSMTTLLPKFTLTRLEKRISGTVTSSEDNLPLPGVSILLKGTTTGTVTGADGKYSISVPDNGGTLVFSYVGYVVQEIAVGNSNTVNVTLLSDVTALEQIVVVGYGTQKREAITGAITTVSSKEVSALPVPNIAAALQGRVAGVTVTNNGSPGEAPIVRIRGIGSISFGSSPLYVIDGLPTGDLNSFDTRDIETVEVLRDASAAAIYGSRASNGVILITTKKGKRNAKLSVNLDSYWGVQTAWRQLDLLKRDDYVRYATALLTNAGNALPPRFSNFNQPIYAGSSQTFAQTDTDWQGAMFRSASIRQHTVSLSGGNEKSRFFASAGYFKQDGIMRGTAYERGNFRINSDHQISKRITFGQNLTVSYDSKFNENNPGGRTQIQNMMRMTPYIPVEDPTKLGGYGGAEGADASDPQNPVRAAAQDINNTQRMKFLGSAYVEVEIAKFLRYKFTGGLDYVSTRNYSFNPIYNEGFNARTPATIGDNRDLFFSPIFTNQLTFEKTFGKHNINAVAVAERQEFRFIGLSTGGNLSSNTIRELSGTTNQTSSGSRSEEVLVSYLGRVNYDYANKYLISASIRYDGSSKFAPGNKWGSFPSVSVGWRINQEEFMKDISQISELKLRASYGTLGFNGIGNYAWQVAISPNSFPIIGGNPTLGAFFDRLGNTDLKWEVTSMTNFGLDLGLFDNKITLAAEYYTRTTNDLILAQPIANSLGYAQPPVVNIGSMENKGLEFVLGYNNKFGDLNFNASGNISFINNKVLNLATENSSLFAGANGDFGSIDITRTVAGEPIQHFYGWKVAGIFQTQAEIDAAPRQSNAKPGDIRFVDSNGDGNINADDRVKLGSFLPKFTYGANFSLNYKGFDLTLFLQGVSGNQIYNGTKVIGQGMLRLFNSQTDVLNAWTPSNTNTNVPRAVNGDPNQNSRTSDRFLENGSYLRIKNFVLGYSVPSSALSSFTKSTLQSARVYFSAQNLLTITKYSGYDPEVGSRFNSTLTNGIDYGQFPQARTIMIGVQLGF